jgi:hypothetical protein
LLLAHNVFHKQVGVLVQLTYCCKRGSWQPKVHVSSILHTLTYTIFSYRKLNILTPRVRPHALAHDREWR